MTPPAEAGASFDDLAIDADGHVHEEDVMFTDYLEPAFHDRTDGWALNADRNRRFIVDATEPPPFPKEISVRKPMTAANRIKVLDKERIRLAVLFPSAALTAGYMEPAFAQANRNYAFCNFTCVMTLKQKLAGGKLKDVNVRQLLEEYAKN